MAELAIWMAGCTTVAIFPTEPPTPCATCWSTARPACCSSASSTPGSSSARRARRACPASRCRWRRLDRAGLRNLGRHRGAHAAAGQAARAAPPDDLAMLLYTSGSTGTPKGVMTSFGADITPHRPGIAADIRARASARGDRDRMLSYLPLAHSFERSLGRGGGAGGRPRAAVLHPSRWTPSCRPAARAAHAVHLGAAPVAEVPAGRVRQDAAGQAGPPAAPSPHRRLVAAKKVLKGLGLDQVLQRAAARRRCRPDLIRWYRRSAWRCTRAMA
jgi:long-chain acyl-CoA synthetase